jgi:two-component system LytT family response regulator
MIKCLIIDDEKLARKSIEGLLLDYEEITLVGQCENGSQAIEAIKTLKPDLIYLDIEMKDMNGFKVLEQIPDKDLPIVIFVTAYDEFAIKAFDFHALDYLLKPYKDERFHRATKIALNSITSDTGHSIGTKLSQLLSSFQTQDLIHKPNKKFPIKSNGRVHLVALEDIYFITASGYYAEIFSKEKKFLLRESLTNLVEQLDDSIFIRIHRSTIINLQHLKELIYSNYGEVDVKMNDASIFRVSKSYKKALIEKIGLN